MIIDTHVHFWKYDKVRDAWITNEMKVLKQDYLPDHLITTLKRNGVDGCVAVQAGQTVRAGEKLAVIEAMKMENILVASQDCVVSMVRAAKGESLSVDQVILEFV